MLQRWEDFGESIFSRMTEEANKARAINLAQGFPDFDCPIELVKEASLALNQGYNQYAPSFGFMDLRIAIADSIAKRRGLRYDPASELSVFSGATEALFCAVMALCQEGDEVLTFEPYYDLYPGYALAARATFKAVPLHAPSWQFNEQELAQAISPKTKVILLNTPHNPTGRVFSKNELAYIADLVKKHNLIVITDEVYEEIVFAPHKHISIAELDGMKERTLVVSSASKTFSVTGWKVGYAAGRADWIQRMRVIHQHTVFCSPSPLQKALQKAFLFPQSFFESIRADYEQKRNFLLQALTENGFRCFIPEGTFFIIADYSPLSELDDETFALWLTREIGVATIPVSAFLIKKNTSKYIRFCFSKRMETLKASADRLAKLQKRHP